MDFSTIIIIVFVIAILIAIGKKSEERRLKQEYHKALLGTDKVAALAAGRKYYSFLRKDGKLTIMDEQMITNDLSTMK